MKTVFKYTLEIVDTQIISMPEGAKILSVKSQHSKPVIYASVDANKPSNEYQVHIAGTGHPVGDDVGEYIGTAMTYGDNLVWHVFVKKL